MPIDWNEYPVDGFYDELITPAGNPRTAAQRLGRYLASLSDEELQERQDAAELSITAMGITFAVYSGQATIDRSWPFDIIPRVISAKAISRCASTIAGTTSATTKTPIQMFLRAFIPLLLS